MPQRDTSSRLRRAVKDNNLFLVKRLIQQTDFRNPDPDTRRFTSLAWAAVLGHEEVFEFLLAAGHDDDELSKDAENNTILSLLAELRPSNTGPTACHPDIMGAALRMARLYYERYPFILEWSNLQGKTALHTAALKGNDDLVRMFCDCGADFDLPDNLGNTPLHYASAWGHISIVQSLIERGCQFTARNNQGFTASDFAYSYNTMNTLQETARMQFEANKKARRQVYQQAAARGFELVGVGSSILQIQEQFLPISSRSSGRIRSSSRSSVVSESDDDNYLTTMPQPERTSFSPTLQMSHNEAVSGVIVATANTFPQQPPSSATHSTNIGHVAASVLSPIVTRMRERDADAMAEYKKRHRSGSTSTSVDNKSNVTTLQAAEGNLSSNGGSSVSHSVGSWIGIPQLTSRRLRPSASAAQLRGDILPGTTSSDQQVARGRSGTDPSTVKGDIGNQGASEIGESRRISESKSASRRYGMSPGRLGDVEDYTGPSSNYAIFPPPPDKPPPGNVTKSGLPSARRAAFALLSKPLSNIDSIGNSSGQKSHRRGISTSELRN